MNAADLAAIKAIHRELNIPADYAFNRGLTPQLNVAETNLVTIAIKSDGGWVQLTKVAASAWDEMVKSASTANVILMPLSGFRSYTHQAEIIRRKLNNGQLIGNILTAIAAPGYSEHHTGMALDIGTESDPPLEESFAHTVAFRWLQSHANSFGFRMSYPRENRHGMVYEPWHWCWHESSD